MFIVCKKERSSQKDTPLQTAMEIFQPCQYFKTDKTDSLLLENRDVARKNVKGV